LQFAPVGVDQLAEVLKPRSAGGILAHSGTVEVISCLDLDGELVPGDLRWGVYVTFRAASEYVKQCFDQYGITTDESGEFAALYRPSHLIGLELPISVAWSALRHVPTGSPREFLGDVAAVAKKNLTVGASLDGEGGETVFGKLMPAADSLAQGALPMGLASNIQLKRTVARDQILTYDDVELPSDGPLVRLRREMEEEYKAGTRSFSG